MEHIDVVRVVPVDAASGRAQDEGFYAALGREGGRVVVLQAAPTLGRLRELMAEGAPVPEVLPTRPPDPAAELVRDVAGAVRVAWGRAQGPGATGPDVLSEAVRAFLGSPSARRMLGDWDAEG